MKRRCERDLWLLMLVFSAIIGSLAIDAISGNTIGWKIILGFALILLGLSRIFFSKNQ